MEELEFIEIPLGGKYGKGKVALVDGDYDGEYFSSFRWFVDKNGYPVRKSFENGKRNTIYLHREVAKPPPGLVTDHKNGDKLNNRSCNLRWASYADNTRNRKTKKRGKNDSKYIGVRHNMTQLKNGKRYKGKTWVVHVKGKYWGSYQSEDDAARRYDEIAIQEYGDYAFLNFPKVV